MPHHVTPTGQMKPTRIPTRKVGAATLAGAIVALCISLLNRLAGAGITVEEAAMLQTIATAAAGYFTTDRPR